MDTTKLTPHQVYDYLKANFQEYNNKLREIGVKGASTLIIDLISAPMWQRDYFFTTSELNANVAKVEGFYIGYMYIQAAYSPDLNALAIIHASYTGRGR